LYDIVDAIILETKQNELVSSLSFECSKHNSDSDMNQFILENKPGQNGVVRVSSYLDEDDNYLYTCVLRVKNYDSSIDKEENK